ncbi:MAG: putative ABC transporter ATP-binding protein [Candidatus Heimdallarchaeota archaeon LC_2]|nr:MAG: putative ABC transporter ATP-binding protein [Candidatus Heimdallarchaeota archaeon LC_2]
MIGSKSNSRHVDPLKVPNNISILVENLKKYYTKNDREIRAIDGINFDVKKGEFYSIIGRSGSGKTTLLNLLGAMERPNSGRIAIGSQTLNNLSEKELTQIRRKKIATVYQSYNLIPVLSAFHNIELPLLLTGMNKQERKERAEKLLDIVGLMDRIDHKPDELSGGEKQRVTIARALANKPEIIFADEPTGDLDSEIGKEIIDLIEGINRDLKTTIILVTHDRELAKRADRIMELRKGKILSIQEGNGNKIRANEVNTRIARDPSYY